MTLTANGKNYIAQNFGISNCCVATGLSWTAVANDGSTVNESGGTASIVARLVTTSVYQRIDLTAPRTGSYTYAALKQANDNTDVTLTDAQWVAANDGSPSGEAQYCYTVTTGSISFASTPSGADIYLDGTLQTVKTPATITGVSAGSHAYTLRLSGYNDATGTVTVTTGQTASVSVTLTPVVTTGSISFSSTPSGAAIYLDNVLQTPKTPATVTGVSVGSHTYTLRLSGYTDAAGTVTVVAGQTATVSVTLTPVVTTGSISFSSTPSGADIYLDNVLQTAKTPATVTGVSAGSHSYTLRLSGYNDATGTVTVTAGQTATVSVTLTPVVTTGSISFASTPSGADIYLDGTLQTAKTPATITSVSAGSHSYILRLSGYTDATGTVTVTAGQTASVSVTLILIVTGLTTNGKNYIAQNFGISNCFVSSGLSWTAVANDNTTVNESGGTASIVARLVTTSVYKRVDLTAPRTGSYTYAVLKQANDNTDVTLTDAQWIAANDGSPTGEAQYCYTVTTGSISFASIPSGTDIYLDGTLQTAKTPATITNVSAGSHTYRLSLTGYNDATGTVTVTAGQTVAVSVTLTPMPGSISFASTPSGADIYLDGTLQTAKTPATITNVTAGSHSYILRLSGYNDATGTVTVTAGQTASISVTLVLTTGSISFASIPSGADIYLDTVFQTTKTPATITNVSTGSHTYRLSLAGYNDATGTIMVTAGQTATVSVTFVLTLGSISFASTPSGADIYLDGTLQTAKTPATITSVSAGSHSYTLRLTGYTDATGTVTVTAGQTSTVSVTLTPVVTTGSISFASSPSGADIYLDGTLKTAKTPTTITGVSAGSHTYILSLTGYNDATGTVTVTAGQTSNVSVTLTPVVTTGSISFASTPSGADIYLDSTLQTAKTPATITSVSTGSHTYILRLSGYNDAVGTVTVTAGQTATVSVTLTSAGTTGSISFTSTPSGANIYLDNVLQTPKTPATITGVAAGSHFYILRLSGYSDATGTVTVTAGQTSTVSVTLTPVGTVGSISFASIPSGAEIYLNGTLVGITPATVVNISAGSYSYILRLTGYTDAAGTVTVVAGQTATVSVTLISCVPSCRIIVL